MQCELKLAKAGFLATTKEDFMRMFKGGLISCAIILLGSCGISYFYEYSFIKSYWIITLFVALVLLLFAFMALYRICHNPILLEKNIKDIKKAMQQKQGN